MKLPVPDRKFFYYLFKTVPQFGTTAAYLCIRNKKTGDMKNTEYNLDALSSIISSEASFNELVNMIDDMGLEIMDVKAA